MHTTWTACVRSEQQYDICSRIFLSKERFQDARHSYELFGSVYLRRRKLLNKGYCIIENKLSVVFFVLQYTGYKRRIKDRRF